MFWSCKRKEEQRSSLGYKICGGEHAAVRGDLALCYRREGDLYDVDDGSDERLEECSR